MIVVLGIYRSGTSAITKSLGTMGVRLPDPSKVCYNTFNEKGSWEDPDFCVLDGNLIKTLSLREERIREIISLNEEEVDFLCEQEVFKKASHLVLEKVRESIPFGIKDPKFCVLLPFWKKVFKECDVRASFVIALRNPLSVVASIDASQKLLGEQEQEKSFWVWISYMISCLEQTEGAESLLVDYDQLVQDPVYQVKRIAHAFQLEIDERALQIYSEDFIASSLRHFHGEENEILKNSFCRAFAMEIYKTLLSVAKGELDFDELKSFLNKWKKQFFEAHSLLVLAEKKEYEVEKLRRVIGEREQTILNMSQAANLQLQRMQGFYNSVHRQNLAALQAKNI